MRKLTSVYVSQRIYDNSLAPIHSDDLGCAIWRAAMVDESCDSATFCGIDNRILINAEQIAASNATLQVSPLSHIGNLLSDLLTDIFNNHVVGRNVLFSVKPPNCE